MEVFLRFYFCDDLVVGRKFFAGRDSQHTPPPLHVSTQLRQESSLLKYLLPLAAFHLGKEGAPRHVQFFISSSALVTHSGPSPLCPGSPARWSSEMLSN